VVLRRRWGSIDLLTVVMGSVDERRVSSTRWVWFTDHHLPLYRVTKYFTVHCHHATKSTLLWGYMKNGGESPVFCPARSQLGQIRNKSKDTFHHNHRIPDNHENLAEIKKDGNSSNLSCYYHLLCSGTTYFFQDRVPNGTK
jgi:hypothetical protein